MRLAVQALGANVLLKKVQDAPQKKKDTQMIILSAGSIDTHFHYEVQSVGTSQDIPAELTIGSEVVIGPNRVVEIIHDGQHYYQIHHSAIMAVYPSKK